MPRSLRALRPLTLSLLGGVLVISAGMASAAGPVPRASHPAPSPSPKEAHQHEPDEDGTTTPGPKPRPTPDPAREAACRKTAGFPDGGSPSEERSSGLAHSMDVLLANCVKNPQAPGLLTALEHHRANLERKAAHDAAKEARHHGREGSGEGDDSSEHGHSHGHHEVGQGHHEDDGESGD
jgi:hypothetical protein